MRISSERAGRLALRTVAAAAMGLWACNGAWALELGRISLQSQRGESLRAEIELRALGAEEAASLAVRIAPADAYRSAGVEYDAALAGAQVSLQQRADGRPVLRISTEQPVQAAFVDLILELGWASGRTVREYTLLLDAPRPAAEAAPTVAAPLMGAAPPAPAVPAPVPQAPAPQAAAAEPAAAAASAAAALRERYLVRRGDTLTGVASQVRSEEVSLDQMLVALFRGNAHAFIDNNMNRLRAGSVLRVPPPGQAAQLPQAQARQVVRLQSADFNAYRQRLAKAAPPARVEDSDRRAGGAVEAAVEDRRTAAPAPDRLRLSREKDKGAAASTEAALSREAEQRDQTQRMAELSRNVDDLRRLAASSPGTGSAAPASAPASAAAAASAPPPVAAASAAASAPDAASAPVLAAASAAEAASAPASEALAASAPLVAEAPSAPASEAAATLPPPVAEAAARPQKKGGQSILASGWLWGGIGGAVAVVLGGLGFMHWRRRAKATAETSFLESRLQPDSFFGGSGGQQVDTREAGRAGAPAGTLDAIGDVDPVAEADVYLAYGRDLQAEEILKEALRADPQRLAIRGKLLEVYAKRQDVKAFELHAQHLYELTQGEGEEWAQARELGAVLDPRNPLYADPTAAAAAPQAAAAPGVDLDFDALPSVPAPAEPARAAESGLRPAAAAAAMATAVAVPTLEADTRPADEEEEAGLPEAAPVDAAAASPSLPFDLDALSLDLDEPSKPALLDGLGEDLDEDGDPLERKLALAEEFQQIGDHDGARALLQEVVTQADGGLKDRAQRMLDALV